jgi:hypothetical protein
VTDEEEIRQLVARHWQLMDDRRSVEWADLFANDGEIAAYVATGDDLEEMERATGRDELLAMADNLVRYEPGHHFGANLVIDVQGATASAISDVQFILGKQQPRVQHVARCHDVFVKGDGRWLFASRKTIVRSMDEGLRADIPARRYEPERAKNQ